MARLVSGADGLAGARVRAGRVLWIERLWPALAPSVAVLALWVAAALLGLAVLLPWPATALLTASAFASAVALAVVRVRRLVPPGRAEIDRRLEMASRLRHRPLAALADRPALPAAGTTLDPDTYAFWVTHQARAAASLGRLRSGLPRPSLQASDRYGLRFVLPVLLVAGVLVARGDAGALLLAAAAPGLVATPGPAGTLQAWITPPRFTGLAPVFLHPGSEPVSVPSGSVLTASLTGSDAIPRLVVPRGDGVAPSFKLIAAGSWQVGLTLRGSGIVRIRQGGHALADWRLTVSPVAAPVVAWDGAPGAWHGGWRTRLPWRASNAYGLASLRAELVPVRPRGSPAIVVRVPLDGTPRAAHGAELPDLSASPFAGTEVAGTLVGTDAIGQAGRSATVRFMLPARPFHDPMARAVLDARRRLALNPEDHSAAADDIAALGQASAFDRAPGALLNLESVASLLRVRSDAGAVDEAEARLWELALVLEDGARHGTGDARSALALRAARERVDRQLERMRSLGSKGQAPAEQAELQKRIDQLRQALAARMRDLTRQALRNGTMLPPDAARQALGGDALQKMMKQLDQSAKDGRMDDATRQLSEMEDMLDRMRPATADDVKRALQQMKGEQQANGQMQALGDMVKRQADLLNRSEKRSSAEQLQESFNGASPGADPAAGREADRKVQRALSRASGALSDQFGALTGKAPEALGKAAAAMDKAGHALASGDDRAAASAQREALRDLQSGGQQMASTLRSGGKGQGMAGLAPGFSAGDGGSEGSDSAEEGADEKQDGKDPLGRALSNTGDAADDRSELDLPDAQARSRKIEEELRRRDSNRERPKPELDYLDRLLKAF
jgi:uncharacterized protein (TIGR02302 family)